MSRRDPVNIVTTTVLKFEKDLGQTLDGNLVFSLLSESLTDLIVLVVYAAEIAQPHKHISGSAGSHKAWLFAEMSSVRRDYWQEPRVTGSRLVLQPVVTAISGADVAGRQHRHELISTALQFSAVKQQSIRWLGHKLVFYIRSLIPASDSAISNQEHLPLPVGSAAFAKTTGDVISIGETIILCRGIGRRKGGFGEMRFDY
jgi:hypothetical protein